MERVLNSLIRRSAGTVPGWAAKAAAICLAAGIAGCAAPEAGRAVPQSAESIVGERAQARWNALIAAKLPEAYQFYSPASRDVMGYEDFIRSIKLGFWKSAQVEKVVCGGTDACEAQVSIEYSYKGTLVKTPISETWIRKDGTWWYVQKG
jgi:hypothetical protein